MAVDTSRTKAALAKRGGGVAVQAPIFDLVPKMQAQVAATLGSEIGATRFIRNVLTTLRQNPALVECSPQSLLGAMMQSAQLRLDPGPLGLVYFVPFANKRTGQKEAQFIVGYRGLIELAYRAGIIITAHEVREADDFTVEWGSEERIVHKPLLYGERGNVLGWYAVAKRGQDTIGTRYYTVEDVEKVRRRAQARDSGPWQTDYEAMALKTVVRALATRLPLSVVGQETGEALSLDATVVTHHADDTLESVQVDEDGVIEGDVVEDEGDLFGEGV